MKEGRKAHEGRKEGRKEGRETYEGKEASCRKEGKMNEGRKADEEDRRKDEWMDGRKEGRKEGRGTYDGIVGDPTWRYRSFGFMTGQPLP
jgi:hypothetical protein